MIERTGPLHKSFRTRHRKYVSECRDRLKFPFNEEYRCPLEEVMKLSMRANELQCHGGRVSFHCMSLHQVSWKSIFAIAEKGEYKLKGS